MRNLLITTTVLLTTTIAANAVPYQVSPTDLNLRAGPSPLHPSMVQMPVGSVVNVGSCVSRDDGVEGPPWCQVNFGRWHGWASTSGMFPVGTPVAAPPPPVSPAPVCSQVTNIPTSAVPNGLLPLRSGPGPNLPMLAQLHPGDVVFETGDYSGNFVHIHGTWERGSVDGWVHGMWTHNVPCPDLPPPTPVVVQKPVIVASPPLLVAPPPPPAAQQQQQQTTTFNPTINITVPPPIVSNNNNNN
jgi:uncharacterized protein YraI